MNALVKQGIKEFENQIAYLKTQKQTAKTLRKINNIRVAINHFKKQ